MIISVVIPAYNEEKYIKRTLDSLQNQQLKANEIIVVDNGSTDKTVGICESMGVKIVKEPKKGIGLARKAGFSKAIGDIIATTDADTILPPDWLYKIKNAFEKNSDVVAVGGPYIFDIQKHKIALKIVSLIWIWGDRVINRGNNVPGVNMAVRKKAYLEVGGYKKDKYFEDLDLSLRLRKKGKVLFLRNILVVTSYRRYASQGFLKTVLNYIKDYHRFIFKGKDVHMEDIREEK